MEGLGPMDAAIILREDNSIELVLPQPPEDDTQAAPANVVTCAALMTALDDEDTMQSLLDAMDEKIKRAKSD